MKEFTDLIKQANTSFRIADHLTSTTFPLVKDLKISITILKNLNHSLTSAMDALLFLERAFKRISPYENNFKSKFQVFKEKVAPKYQLTSYLPLILEIHNIIKQHSSSEITFIRKEKLIITNNHFHTQTITIEKIKNYISESRPFINKLNKILLEHERIFRR